MKMKLNELQEQVGEWAHLNFGDNISRVRMEDATGDNITILNEIAPLLGLFEEAGEFAEAETPNEFGSDIDLDVVADNQKDALGDMGIYLLDFTTRLGIPIEEVNNTTPTFPLVKHPYQLLILTLGRLAHVNLKRHQGIRGYDNPVKFDTDVRQRIGDFLNVVKPLSKAMFKIDFWENTEWTWEKIVKKRDWKANNQTG